MEVDLRRRHRLVTQELLREHEVPDSRRRSIALELGRPRGSPGITDFRLESRGQHERVGWSVMLPRRKTHLTRLRRGRRIVVAVVLRTSRGDLVDIHELRVVKHDGKVDRFPVDGDLAQAELRASLTQLPGDLRIAVTEHAYIRVEGARSDGDKAQH